MKNPLDLMRGDGMMGAPGKVARKTHFYLEESFFRANSVRLLSPPYQQSLASCATLPGFTTTEIVRYGGLFCMPRELKLKEYLLSDPVSEFLADNGYTVYTEIGWTGRTVDMVGVRDGSHIAVELKTSLSYSLLLQCLPLQFATEFVYAATPARPTAESFATFQRYGIGVLRVSTLGVEILSPARSNVKPQDAYAFNLEGKVPGGIAGFPNSQKGRPGERGSKWYTLYNRLTEFYKHNPVPGCN